MRKLTRKSIVDFCRNKFPAVSPVTVIRQESTMAIILNSSITVDETSGLQNAATSTDGRQAPNATRPGKTGKPNTAKRQRPHGQQQGKAGARPPRTDRPDRSVRRGPSPNSPFAGLAALMAEARKD